VLRIWQIWQSGGWVMIPLFGLAVLLYAQAFQLVLYVRRTDLGGEDEMAWGQWVREPEAAQGRVAEVIRYTQSDVSSARQVRNRFDEVRLALVASIERRTRFVSSLVAAAPLMGLLGTVLGMLRTFYGIATSAGVETVGGVASGISEALVTTQTGLTISLPGLFLVMVIQRRKHKLEANLARLESLTLGHLRYE
jgi:biopolymer transport protein ExbB